MSFGNLIWVFFILSMMQPLLNRRLLEAQRRRLIAQIGQMPAASLLRVLADKPIAEIDDKTIVLADQAGKAIRQVHAAIKELTEGRHEPDKAEELAKLLSEGTWTHDHPITFAEAKNFGLPVRSDMPE